MKLSTALKLDKPVTQRHITATRLRSKINQVISLSDGKPLVNDVTRVYSHNDGNVYGQTKDHYNKSVKVKLVNGVWFKL